MLLLPSGRRPLNTSRHGFRDTGIVPFKPEVVISQLPPRLHTPNESDDGGSELSLTTPKTARKVEMMWDALDTEDADDAHWWDIFNKLERASLAQAHLVEQLKRELANTEQAKKARKRRAEASHRHVSVGGVIKSSQVRNMVRLEQKYDLVKEHLNWRKKWKACIKEFIDTLLARGIIVKRQRLTRQSTNS